MSLVDKMEVVYSYTSEEAEEDGVLVNLFKINKKWRTGLLKYATTNLMITCGYMDGRKINHPALCDLLNQIQDQIRRKTANFKKFDSFFSCEGVEFPNGGIGTVFVGQNESGKFTLMLPEDY